MVVVVFLMEFVYIILLGNEFSVDFLESREGNYQEMIEFMKISSLKEGLHFLVKQN